MPSKKNKNRYLEIAALLWQLAVGKARTVPNKISQEKIPSILSRFFLHNYKIKLLSLIFAIFFSVYVIGQSVEERNFTVPLIVKHDIEYALGENVPRDLVVYISGAKNDLNNIDINKVSAELDLLSKKEGVYQYTPVIRGLDPKYQVASISPEKVVVVLSKLQRKRVRIIPKLIGQIKQNYEINSYTTTPSRVWISGPEEILEQITVIYTEPIDIDGLQSNKEIVVDLNKSTHPSLSLANNERFLVKIFISARKIEKLVNGKFLINADFSNRPLQLSAAQDYFVREVELSITQEAERFFVPSRDLFFYINTSSITQPGSYRLRVLSKKVRGVEIKSTDPRMIDILVEPGDLPFPKQNSQGAQTSPTTSSDSAVISITNDQQITETLPIVPGSVAPNE